VAHPSDTIALEQPAREFAQPKTRSQWSQLATLTLAIASDNTETSVLKVLFPTIKASLALTLTDLGLLVAGNKIAGAIFGPCWVWLARRWGRKAILVVSSGLWGVWSIAAGFSTSFAMLLAMYCVFAAGVAGAHIIVTEVLSDLFDDKTRGRAVGYMYGSLQVFISVVGPLLGQLSGVPDGWRIAFWLAGAFNILGGVLIAVAFRDPGLGASEVQPVAGSRETPRLDWNSALSIFRIPTFNLMLLSRLLSGHLLMISFGVVYLTEVYKFPNNIAALTLFPFGIGYVSGAFGGATLADYVHAKWPNTGRVAFLQLAQILFAGAAFVGTQFDWGNISIFSAFWFLIGLLQGVNPGVNRPIIMSVIRPELRGVAFAVMISIVESIAWAAYGFSAGWLGDIFGLKVVFLVILVGFMLLNALAITPLYWTYRRDVERMLAEESRAKDFAAGLAPGRT
jgi:predicted MFS family arabinose efflux permease